MYHPTTRVLTVLELLQTHAQLSGRALAQRLEVSERSVHQYVVQLQDLGIPVEGVRGRHGGYRLRPGFKLPPLMFTEDEAVALTLGLLAAHKMGLTVAAPAAEGALAKVERVLPDALRQRVQMIQSTLVIDGNTPYLAPASEVVVVLSQAAQECQRVGLVHRSWDGSITTRAFDPYGVVHHSGRWFVAGYCCLRKERRVFRLDRVISVQLSDERFERPAACDVLGLVIEAVARTPGRWRIEVLLKTTLADAQLHIPASLAVLEQTDAGVLLRCAVQQLEWFAHFLTGLECAVVVREPLELRQTLRALAKRTMAMADAGDA